MKETEENILVSYNPEWNQKFIEEKKKLSKEIQES